MTVEERAERMVEDMRKFPMASYRVAKKELMESQAQVWDEASYELNRLAEMLQDPGLLPECADDFRLIALSLRKEIEAMGIIRDERFAESAEA